MISAPEKRKEIQEPGKIYIRLPDEVHDLFPDLSYTIIGNDRQLTWVQFDKEDLRLVVALNCDEELHSMKFIVYTKR